MITVRAFRVVARRRVSWILWILCVSWRVWVVSVFPQLLTLDVLKVLKRFGKMRSITVEVRGMFAGLCALAGRLGSLRVL